MLSLQFKATVLIVILTLSVTTAVAAYLLRGGGELAPQLRGEQMFISTSLLAQKAAPYLARDLQALNRLARESANGQPLMYAVFYDAQGRPLTSAEHGDLGLLRELSQTKSMPVAVTPQLTVDTQGGPQFMELTYPIMSLSFSDTVRTGIPAQLLGYVRTGFAAHGWHQPLTSRLDVFLGVGALSLVAALPLGFFLVRRLVGPLEGLAETMNSFSMGRLDVRSPIRRRDELGRLSQAFNQMADQHQQTHLRIVRLNAELEERVAYRTHQLRELASRDPLTGLYNRRHFSDVLEHRFAEAVRYQTDLSGIMIDLDDFKSANDAFGHQIGDQVLQLAAGTIVGQLRTSDLAARYGGDEFILLLPQTDLERAQILGERVVQRFNSELSVRFPKSTVRMSMGIASLRSLEAQSAEALIQAADHALYMAKTAGKNRIVMAVPAA